MKQKACNEIQQQNNDYDDETYFLGSIENKSDTEPWYVNLKVNNRILSFKIDTGADVSVISEATYKHLRPKPNLIPIRSTLSSPGGVLHCLGKFECHKAQGKDIFTAIICDFRRSFRQFVISHCCV